MVLLDNSEYMRNGDCVPSRLEAQSDAVYLICCSKNRQNPENTVGIISMAGSYVQVMCSPTDDMGNVLKANTQIKIGGKSDLGGGLAIAQLALKHRKNKNGGQKIVVFVGSPIETEESKLLRIGKQLKKGNVAVDIVALGQEQEDNMDLLKKFLDVVNKNGNSHLISIPIGVLPSDVLISTPVITGDDNDGSGMAGDGSGDGMGAFAEFGGVDPNLDPELALALRVSLEEARAETEKRQRSADNTAQTPPHVEAASTAAASADEEALLQRALLISMAEGNEPSTSTVDTPLKTVPSEEKSTPSSLQGAVKTSTNAPIKASSASEKTESSTKSQTGSRPAEAGSIASSFLDPDFIKVLVTNLPGVDVDDPKIQAAISGAAHALDDKSTDDEKNESDSKKKDDKDKSQETKD